MIITNDTEFYTMLKTIEQFDIIAVDTETTGLNVRQDTIVGIGLALSPEISFYIPTYKFINNKLQKTQLLHRMQDLLSALKNKKLIFHNASYDIRIIQSNYDVNLLNNLYADTMLMHHTTNENPPHALKSLAKKFFGEDSTEEQKVMKESVKKNGGSVTKKNYEMYKADLEPLAKYCEQDCKLTIKLFNLLSQDLESQGLTDFFYKQEVMPLYKNVTIPAEMKGIPVDVPKLEKTLLEITEDMKVLEQKVQSKLEPYVEPLKLDILNKLYGVGGKFQQFLVEHAKLDLPKTASGKYSLNKKSLEALPDSKYKSFLLKEAILDNIEIRDLQYAMHKKESGSQYFINIQSKDQLKNLIFKILKEKPLKLTPHFQPVLDEAMLLTIKDKYDFIPDLITYTKLLKIKSSYIERFLDNHEQGIFYPYFLQHGTTSGRYSSDLQQLPRPIEEQDKDKHHPLVYKYNNIVREFFISGENYKFLDADFESLEAMIFAHCSQSDWLCSVFDKGHDLYSTVGIGAYNVKDASADKSADNYLKKIHPSIRQNAKAFTLGIPYGLEAFKLSKDLDIKLEAAEDIVNNYLNSATNEDGTGLRKYMQDCEASAVEQGFVKNDLGRIRHLEEAKEIYQKYGSAILDPLQLWKDYHESPGLYADMKKIRRRLKNLLNNAKNFPIQSLAASIVNRSAIEISKQLEILSPDAYVCAQIHDQLVIRCPKNDVDKISKMMQNIMENIVKLRVQLKAKPEVADNFKEGH